MYVTGTQADPSGLAAVESMIPALILVFPMEAVRMCLAFSRGVMFVGCQILKNVI